MGPLFSNWNRAAQGGGFTFHRRSKCEVSEGWQGLANRLAGFLEGAKRKEPKPGGRALATGGAKRNVAQGRRSAMDRAADLVRRRALREGTARWDGWRKTGEERKGGGLKAFAMAPESGGCRCAWLKPGKGHLPARESGRRVAVVGETAGINGVWVRVKRSRPAIGNGETRKREGQTTTAEKKTTS